MDGLMPTMKSGDILGHEFVGEVVEIGSTDHKLKKGDRIVVPFNINCGECRQCKMGLLGLPAVEPQCGDGR
jgi:threonine dehydrogenase-like Zn-dependent dehydrogenase